MRQRLEQFLEAENISRAQFADKINVARAGISHILSGRNNPSYEFIVNTMTAFPELNIEWLLKGKGNMFKTSTESSSNKTASVEVDEDEGSLFSSIRPSVLELNNSPSSPFEQVESPASPKPLPELKSNCRSISKVIAFFTDGTFEEIC